MISRNYSSFRHSLPLLQFSRSKFSLYVIPSVVLWRPSRILIPGSSFYFFFFCFALKIRQAACMFFSFASNDFPSTGLQGYNFFYGRRNRTLLPVNSFRPNTWIIFPSLTFQVSRFFFMPNNTWRTDFFGPVKDLSSRKNTIVEMNSPRMRTLKLMASGVRVRTLGCTDFSS